MKKTNKSLVIVVFVILIALVSSYFFFGDSIRQSVTGFQTLALGSVDFTSNDPSVGGKAWVLTVSQNGAGQSAYGNFKAKDSGTESNDFTINLDLLQNYATYKINQQNLEKIKSVEWTKTTYNPFSSSGGCNTDVWKNWQKPSGSTVYCYNFVDKGVYGTLDPANVNFQSKITVSGSGGTDSCTISNKGASSCTSNKGNVVASWAGSLVSGESAPSPSGQGIAAIYDTSAGGWKTINNQLYQQWKTKHDGLISCIANVRSESCFKDYQVAYQKVMTGQDLIGYGGSRATTNGGQLNGQVRLELAKQIQFPVITMKVKADLIGINIPVGEPKIVSVNSDKFLTGQTGIIEVNVKNAGSGQGSFSVYAECSTGFSQTGGSGTISGLNPGKSQTIFLTMTGNAISGSNDGYCDVTARDINNPDNYDTKRVSVSVSAISICTEGEISITGNQIQQCKKNVWTTIKTCDSTQKAQKNNDGTTDCVDLNNNNNDGDGNSFWDKLKNFFKNPLGSIGNLFGDFITILKLIAGVVGLVISFSFTKRLLERFNISYRTAVITSVIVSLLILYLIIQYFLTGVIILGVYFGLVSIIKFIKPF